MTLEKRKLKQRFKAILLGRRRKVVPGQKWKHWGFLRDSWGVCAHMLRSRNSVLPGEWHSF